MSFGYSIGDFIVLANKANDIFDAIHHKERNAPRQIRILADQFDQFGKRLKELGLMLQRYDISTFDGLDGFEETLNECARWIDKYEALNDPSSAIWKRWLKDGLYTNEQKTVQRLQAQVSGHVQNISLFQNNVML